MYLGLRISTLFASAVFGVYAPSSQSFTRLRTLQKLGLGERDFALGPVFSVPFVFFVPVVFFFGVAEGSLGTGLRAPGAGVLSLVAGTERFMWDMASNLVQTLWINETTFEH